MPWSTCKPCLDCVQPHASIWPLERKGFEGLYGLVRDRLSCEPLSGHLFLFCNGQRNRLDYLSAILPGLADFPIRCLPDLTPALWVARHS